MKKLYRIALTVAVTLGAALTTLVPVTSCDGQHPIEVIQTDYKYSINVDDIHIAEGVRAECVIRLSSSSVRDESIAIGYRVDDDVALRIMANGREVVSGSSVNLDAMGVIRLTLPELGEGLHVLHLTLTNQYGKTVTQDISFQVIRDKVWATGVAAPSSVKLEKGAYLDTTVSIIPADADILSLGATSSNPDVIRASLSGDGATKTLRLESVSEGSASVTLNHEDIQGPAATVAVEVYSHKIEGMPATMSLTEGDDATLTLSVTPAATITLTSSSSCLTVSSPTSSSGVWTLKAVSPGTATLVATAGRSQATCAVTVSKKPETIAISPMSAIIPAGGTKVFDVVSSADFSASLSTDAATIVERTATSVTVRNDNRSFRDAKVNLTVSNAVDPTKRAVADIMLEKRAETISLTESISEPGRSIWSVGGENDGWAIVESPAGLRCETSGNTIVLTNTSYKSIMGALVVKTKEQGVAASKDISVQGLEVKLSSLTAEPASFSVEENKSVSFAVSGKYNDGTTRDVTSSVTWTQSSNLQRSGNTFTGTEPGSAWIRASLDDKSVSIDGSVTKKPVFLNSLEIDPAYFSALVDESRLFSVTANFSDGSHRDVTRECEWSVTGSAMAAGKGYYKFPAAGEVLVEATYTHEGTTLSARSVGNITKPSGTVTGVTIEPKEKRLKVGETVTFSGTVRYSDGTQDASGTFSVSPGGILSGADGSYVAVAEGTVSVTYSYAGYSATAAVTVSVNGGTGPGDVISDIILNTQTLTVYVGKASSITATAIMGDGSAKDISGQAVWSSSNSGVATVDSFGRITGLKAGTATVTATHGGKSATCSVVVEEEVTLASVGITPSSLAFTVGDPSQQVSAKAYYSDGTSRDVTNLGTWSTGNGSVATVSAGTVTAIGAGTTNVTCSYQGKEGNCAVSVSKPAVVVVSATMSQSQASMTVGETLGLTVTYKFSDGTGGSYGSISTWTSSDPSVATVSSGKVTARKAGTTTISAKLSSTDNAQATCVVTVSPAAVTLSSVRLNTTSLSLPEGSTYTLPGDFRLTAVMSDGSTRDATYDASWSIAAGSSYITLSGMTLKAVKKSGSATLRGSYTYGGVTKTADVTVSVTEKEAPTVQSLSASSFSMAVGESVTMTGGGKFKVYAKMSDGTTEDVTSKATYTVVSQNPSGAVSQNGNVIVGNKAGAGSLRASYGGKTVDFAFTVTEKTVPVTSISLNKSNMSVAVNGSETLSVTFNNGGEVPTNTAVTWSSSQQGIATVNQYGKVTGVATGTCVITVTSVDGGKRAQCNVTVTPEVVAVQGITLNPTSTSVIVGGTATITATITPSNASNKNISWRSNNNGVATVDASGIVTGKGVGNATITAETEDGHKTATCQVSVTAAPVAVTGVEIYRGSEKVSGGSIRAALNDNVTLTAKVIPDNATNQNVTWSSSDASVVSVSATGAITALKQQSATITVKTADGGKTASVRVEGYQETYAISLDQDNLEWEYDKSGEKTIRMTLTNVTSVKHTYNKGNFIVSINNSNKTITVRPNGSMNTQSMDISDSFYVEDEAGKAARKQVFLTWKKKPDSTPTTVTLNIPNHSGPVKSNVTINATVKDQFGNAMSDARVSWSSSPEGYVRITPGSDTKTATLTATATGSNVKVYATSGTVKGEYTVSTEVDLNGISFSEPSVSLYAGKTMSQAPSFDPASGLSDNQKKVTWTSSNTSVATVDANGTVTAKAAGTATITATSSYKSSVKASYTVTVMARATSVTISGENGGKYDKDYNAGQFTLTASLSPSGVSPAEVEWSVSNSNIISISNAQALSCTFKINAVGQVTVYAKWKEDNSVSGQYTVTIQDSQQLIAFDPNNNSYTVEVGETKNVTTSVGYIYGGSGGYYTKTDNYISGFLSKNKNWSVSITPQGIIEYDQSKNTVKGISVGTATITLKNGSAQQETYNSITVSVKASAPVISIPQQTYTLDVGSSISVTATVKNPDDSVNENNMSWSIKNYGGNNNGIISIEPSGNSVKINGVSNGQAVVVVKSGDKEASFTVNVKNPGQEEWSCIGLDPVIDGTSIQIIATLEHQSTGAQKTEDVTKDVKIKDKDQGLTVTLTNPAVGKYYLVVNATKNGTYCFNVAYRGEEITMTVTKSGNTYNIH